MRSKNKKRKLARWKTKLGLPGLDHAKAAGFDGNIKILSIQESKSRLTPEKWIS